MGVAVSVVFDTNVVIDLLNGLPEAAEEYDRHERVVISRITWMEVLVGGDDSETRAFLRRRFQVAPLSPEVAERAVTLRRKHRRLRLPDAIIWATAQRYEFELLTRNRKDFPAEAPDVRTEYLA